MNRKVEQFARKCIFCGGGSLSKEHFWPAWASILLPKYPANSHVEHIVSFSNKRLARAPKLKQRPGSTWTKKIRVVCRSCNNGWMSALETAVQPILTPLILGQAQTLDQASSLLISRWVALKVFVGEQSQIGDIVTSHEQREAFRTTLTIPNNFRIWIGKCGVEGWEAAYWRNAATISLSPDIKPEHRNKNVHSVTFGIGYLLVYAFHTTVDNTDFDFSLEQQQIAKALYPIREVVKWPPFKSVTGYGASIIAHALNDLLHGSRVFWKPLPD